MRGRVRNESDFHTLIIREKVILTSLLLLYIF